MSKVIAIRADVYSRVCGYFQPVQNWNIGKQAEYADRVQHEPAGIVKHFGPADPVVRHG